MKLKHDPDFQAAEDRAYSVTASELRAFIERFERLEADKRDIADDQKEVMAEAKSRGYCTKSIRKLVAERKRDKDDLAEEAAILDMYRSALGMAHETAVDCGWWADPETGAPIQRNTGELIALIHSEVSEGLEADRKGLNDDKLTDRPGLEVELADAILRILDLAGARGLDVAGALVAKNRYNRNRHDHTPEARAAGGKRY